MFKKKKEKKDKWINWTYTIQLCVLVVFKPIDSKLMDLSTDCQ